VLSTQVTVHDPSLTYSDREFALLLIVFFFTAIIRNVSPNVLVRRKTLQLAKRILITTVVFVQFLKIENRLKSFNAFVEAL
jgi:hypothetical protein